MNTGVSRASTASVMGYVAIFAILYTLQISGVQFLIVTYEIHPGAGSNMTILMISALVAMMKFVYDNKRPPEKMERRKLVWLSVLSSIFISVLFAIALLVIMGDGSVMENLSRVLISLDLLTWLAVFLSVVLVNYVVFRLNYGLAAKLCHRCFTRAK